jgi:cytochrome c-type biogenesis protein CcmH
LRLHAQRRALTSLLTSALGLLVATSAFAQASSPASPASPAGTEASSAESADPEGLVGRPRGTPLAGAALEARTREVASLLRCPVCQGLSIADSPSTMAVDMKAEAREMLARGYTQDQILAYFERSYGEFVRLKPPLRGVNWLVWMAPVAALLLGGFVVARTLRARTAAVPPSAEAAAETLPSRGSLPEDPELARYVRRARELVYGWPDGEPPAEDA